MGRMVLRNQRGQTAISDLNERPSFLRGAKDRPRFPFPCRAKTMNERRSIMFLFLDCETTGLPNNYRAPSSAVDNWPRVVSIAWRMSKGPRQPVSEGSAIIKPEGFVIPAEATAIHGITQDQADKEGENLSAILLSLIWRIEDSNVVVGHNIEFDAKVIGAEFIRRVNIDPLELKPLICTMRQSTDFCKIPGPYGVKWPKLGELYKKLFESEIEGQHSSAADVEACERCFWELVQRGIIQI